MTLQEIIEKSKSEPITEDLINDLLSHILTEPGVQRWWFRPIADLGGITPWDAWSVGYKNVVLAVVLDYLDPSFS
jgi:hypothetical protein